MRAFLQQAQERAAAVVQVRQPVLDLRRAERMHVEADIFAVLAVTVALQRAHLVEGDAQIGAAEGFVLVELEAVLVVEMQRPQLAEGHREIDFVRRIKAGQYGVGGSR